MSPGSRPARLAGEASPPKSSHDDAADLGQSDVGRVVGRSVPHRDAQRGPAHPAVLDQLVHDRASQVDRNREAVAGVEPGAAGDRGVDADDLASDAHQRTAGVAGVDRGVGLDEVLDAAVVGVGQGQAPALGADDAGGDGEGQVLAQRVAHGEDPFTHPGRVAVAQRRGGEVVGVDLEHGQVGAGVGADDLGLELPPIEQAHRHLVGAVHHVVVGQDVAVTGDDEAGARRLLELGRCICGSWGKNRSNPGGSWGAGAVVVIVALPALLARLDEDHAGLDLFGHRGERLAQRLQSPVPRRRRLRGRGL